MLQAGLATHYCESSRIPILEQVLCNMADANDVDDVLNDFCPATKLDCGLSKTMDQINECFDADSVEEIFGKLERDGGDWAKKTIKVI